MMHPKDEKEGEDFLNCRTPPLMSIATAFYCLLIQVSAFTIVLPTAQGYTEALGSTRLISGVVLGIGAITAVGGQFAYVALAKRTSLRFALQVANVIMLLGCILYALAFVSGSPATLIVSRAIQGLGTCASLNVQYIGRAVGTNYRSLAMQFLATSIALGYAAPIVGFLLLLIPEKDLANDIIVNQHTLPGWTVAAGMAVGILAMFIWFQEPPTQAKLAEITQTVMMAPASSGKSSSSSSSSSSTASSSSPLSSSMPPMERGGGEVTHEEPSRMMLQEVDLENMGSKRVNPIGETIARHRSARTNTASSTSTAEGDLEKEKKRKEANANNNKVTQPRGHQALKDQPWGPLIATIFISVANPISRGSFEIFLVQIIAPEMFGLSLLYSALYLGLFYLCLALLNLILARVAKHLEDRLGIALFMGLGTVLFACLIVISHFVDQFPSRVSFAVVFSILSLPALLFLNYARGLAWSLITKIPTHNQRNNVAALNTSAYFLTGFIGSILGAHFVDAMNYFGMLVGLNGLSVLLVAIFFANMKQRSI